MGTGATRPLKTLLLTKDVGRGLRSEHVEEGFRIEESPEGSPYEVYIVSLFSSGDIHVPAVRTMSRAH